MEGGGAPHEQTCPVFSSSSEETLGAHDTLQRFYKYELAVPLRLLPLSSVKHRLARDVSQTPAAEQGSWARLCSVYETSELLFDFVSDKSEAEQR